MTDRPTELATLAIRRHEATGMPLLDSIAAAIRQAVDELAGEPPAGASLIGQVVSPGQIDEIAKLAKGTSYSRLKRAVEMGLARKERVGRYRILGGTAMLLAPAHRGVRVVA